MREYLLALDQGTTSSRAILFDRRGNIISSAQYRFPQHFPRPGWVEHDPMDILDTQFRALGECMKTSGVGPEQVAALGITNQRETVLLWEKDTGKPLGNAIVWQCRRTAEMCSRMEAEGLGEMVRQKTGLRMDAYFSGTKYRWLLDNIPGARERAEKGEVIGGTIDTWLLWNLTGGRVHASDYSNCSRTMLFDLRKLCWDEELCHRMDVPMSILPRPVESCSEFGEIAPGVPHLEGLEGIPIRGMVGDQQSALFGQACFAPGQIKNTYGTGCFTLLNTGNTPILSRNGLLTCVGWSIGGKATYVLEGSVYNAGASIRWLEDIGLISDAVECDKLARTVLDNGGAYLVSAFTGLGAPHWDMYARGTIVGLTRGTTKAHLCRATLEGIAYQTADLIEAMQKDLEEPIESLRIDGGVSNSSFLMGYQADLLGIPVERPKVVETTAWGAACMAGLGVGLWNSVEEIAKERTIGTVTAPTTDRTAEFARWHEAVERAKHWEKP